MIDWQTLEDHFDASLVKAVQQRLLSGSSPQVDPEPFVLGKASKNVVLQLFGMLVEAGVLRTETVLLCPACSLALSSGDVQEGICPHCKKSFYESGEPPTGKTIYLTSAGTSRDIPWLIAIHGFNTHGEWQEDFSWLLATRFRHRAPALMFKFPLLRYGVFFRSRHDHLVDKLAKRIRAATDRAEYAGIIEPPDIVAHSFGSLLFAKLLDRKACGDLRFGRVILAGSIVEPDYDWSKHVNTGRIEAIFNHCSAKDRVVDFSPYAIPDSGPSGRVGFDDAAALNYRESEFEHGTHFEPNIMIESLAQNGRWDVFLRFPLSSLKEVLQFYTPEKNWKPVWWPLRTATRLVAYLIPVFMVVVGVMPFVLLHFLI